MEEPSPDLAATDSEVPARGRRQRVGRGRSRKREPESFQQPAFRQPQNPYPPIAVLSDDEIEALHVASLTVLEEIGMDFLHPEARRLLKSAGAEVTEGSERVRFPADMAMAHMATCPEEFTLHARNPAHNLRIGGNWMSFSAVASAPNVSDLANGRRPGNFTDYCNLLRLSQILNIIHFNGGYPVEPIDLPPSTRHLDALAALATLTDKPFHAYSLGRTRILDGLEIIRIVRQLDDAALQTEPSLISVINTSSPLRLDTPMIEGILQMARMKQPLVITPFTLSGAMAPATIAGALTQQNAEALAGMVLVQVINPGAPVVYGGFTSNVDMKTGAPAFGTPEYTRAAWAGGQLARRYRVPYRSSNANASNAPDAQATYEAAMSLWGAVMGHANIVKHAAGWLEGGLTASFEKMIIDAEHLQSMAEALQPLDFSADAMGLDAIREVGPGGHFFGAAHTLARYENAFYSPILSDWRNFESWQEAGSVDTTERAYKLSQTLLESYQEPPIDAAIREQLQEFVTRRKQEGGAPDH